MFLINDIFNLLPEIFLIFLICFFLIDGVAVNINPIYTHKYRTTSQVLYNFFFIYVLLFGILVLVLIYLNLPSFNFILNQYNCISSSFLSFCKIFILSLFLLFLILCNNNKLLTRFYEVEFFILFLLALFGLISLLSSFDWLLVYLSIEIYSLACYCLVAFKKKSIFSTEGGLKYFILGSFSSGLLIFGISFLYGSTGTLNLAELQVFSNYLFLLPLNYDFFLLTGFFFIFTAFLFKLTCAPFHFWAIDAYDGAPLIVTSFLSIIPKIALLSFFGLLYQQILPANFYISLFFWFVVICSIFIGTFGAVSQRLIKRMFIYSMVANTSFFIAALSVHSFSGLFSWIFFLFMYSFIMLGIFIFLNLFRFAISLQTVRSLSSLKGLWNSYTFQALSLSILLFSLSGIPPLSGFFSKFFVLVSLISSNFFFLSFWLIMFSILSLFYYLRIIKFLFFDDEISPMFLSQLSLNSALAQSIIVLGMFLFCIAGGPLLLLIHRLALSILS